MMRAIVRGMCLGALMLPVGAQSVARYPHELGAVRLKQVVMSQGKVAIRVASGGCTEVASIAPRVQKGAEAYEVLFERVQADGCKAFLPDGVVLEYGFEKDLGIPADATLRVLNTSEPDGPAVVDGDLALKKDLLAATLKALELELRGYEEKAKTARGAQAETIKSRIEELTGRMEGLKALAPGDYALPAVSEDAPISLPKGYGPVMPPLRNTLRVTMKEAGKEGGMLDVPGMTKSGPFYRLAGIAGGDYSRLKAGASVELVAYLVYKREYFSFIPDYYVFVAEVK